jgi:hypothetical protein
MPRAVASSEVRGKGLVRSGRGRNGGRDPAGPVGDGFAPASDGEQQQCAPEDDQECEPVDEREERHEQVVARAVEIEPALELELVPNAADAPDEGALVAAAKEDPRAFGALYELYVDRVYRYAYRRVGTHHEAEDITAQAFQQALQDRKSLE